MHAHTLVTLVELLGFMAAVLAFAYLALRSALWTSAVLVAVWITTTALRDSVDLSLMVSSVRLTAMDVLALCLIVIGVARSLAFGIRDAGRGLALVLLVLLGIHITRGAMDFGVQTAVSSARGWLYFTATLVYASTVPFGWDRR